MRSLLLAVCAAGALTLLAPGCSPATPDLVERVEAYERVSNAHDVEAKLDLFAEGAHWEFPYRKDFTVEKRAFRGYFELERVLQSEIDFHDCVQEGRRVRCSLTETSRWMEMHDAGVWRADDVEILFDEEGLIERIIWGGKDEQAIDRIMPVWIALESWAKKRHPEKLRAIFVPGENRIRWEAEAGETMLELGRAWIDAGRPGYEEARATWAERKAERAGRAEEADGASPKPGERDGSSPGEGDATASSE